MFDRLVASGAVGPGVRGWLNAMLVASLHAAVITVATWATRRESVARVPFILESGEWPESSTPDSYPDPGVPGPLPGLPDPSFDGVPRLPEWNLGPTIPGPAFPMVGQGPGRSLGAAGDSAAVPVTLVEQRPELISAPVPAYPEPLRRLGIEGRVIVDVVVDTLGRVEIGSLSIVQSDHAGLIQPVRHTLSRALFRPARVHGRPVRVLVRIPFEFRLGR